MTNKLIGNFSKRTLLTGAGWSRNWGGLLATEIWEAMIGHVAVRNNSLLRELLLKESSFEIALGKTHAPPFTMRDRQDFEEALRDAFISMDQEISRAQDPWINIYKVQELLSCFCPRGHTGYIFTLNQDLFFERKFYNFYNAPAPSLPGLQARPNQR